MTEIIADFELDVRGQCCPFPLVKTKDFMDSMESGEVLKVIADDQMTPNNILVWTKKSGDEILEVEEEGDLFIVYVRKA